MSAHFFPRSTRGSVDLSLSGGLVLSASAEAGRTAFYTWTRAGLQLTYRRDSIAASAAVTPYDEDAENITDGRWRSRAAPQVRVRDRLGVGLLLGVGLTAVVRLFDWWFRGPMSRNPRLFVLLSIAFWYGVGRIVLGWINYAAMKRPADMIAPTGLGVAIFTTSAPGEPPGHVREDTRSLCRRIRYPHTTYLLDDTGDPRVR